MFWLCCLRNTKQLSMPNLSNKRGVFEVTTTQRAAYICCYDLEVRSPRKKDNSHQDIKHTFLLILTLLFVPNKFLIFPRQSIVKRA